MIDQLRSALEYYNRMKRCNAVIRDFYLNACGVSMATRQGWEKTQWLQSRGWTVKGHRANIPPDELPVGDAVMLDPCTGTEHTPYEGERIQLERERNGGLGI